MLYLFPVPNSCRRARSARGRRPSIKGSPIEFSSCGDGSSSAATASMDQWNQDPVSGLGRAKPEFHVVQCNMSSNGECRENIFGSVEAPVVGTETKFQPPPSNNCSNSREHFSTSRERGTSDSTAEPVPSAADESILPASRSHDGPKGLIQRDQANGIFASKSNDACIEGGRGKRKRKPKVHFNELSAPNKSSKGTRRLKIMRYLGLVAPAGSPFAITRDGAA